MRFGINDRVVLLRAQQDETGAIEAGRLGKVVGLREIINAYRVLFDDEFHGRLISDSDLGPALQALAASSPFQIGQRVRLRIGRVFDGTSVEAGRGGSVVGIRDVISACNVLFDQEPAATLVSTSDLEAESAVVPREAGIDARSRPRGTGRRAVTRSDVGPSKGTGSARAASGAARDAHPSPAGVLKILCVHGIGNHQTTDAWQGKWGLAIRTAIGQWNPSIQLDFRFPVYDPIFERHPVDASVVAGALWKLSSSGLSSAIDGVSDAVEGFFDGLLGRRGLTDIPNQLRWTAGMVAQWADSDALRAETRTEIARVIAEFEPDVIAAHSLGSLVCYDLFSQAPDMLAKRRFVSFGSQIANPFVLQTFGGRIAELAQADHWYHLFNPNDRAFTRQVRLSPQESSRFSQVDTAFRDGFLSHDAVGYLSHPAAVQSVWRDVTNVTRSVTRSLAQKSFHIAAASPDRRALLIGINEYPAENMRLAGCVNDVYLMSASLQESGFAPEEIRVVLDNRATAAGILERMNWLLDNVDSDNQRVLYYSGHGAQLPGYGAFDEIDHVDECLVPWDFDWSQERAFTDKQFQQFYSQLPYDSHFLAIFDCCHSGGMTRDGTARVRGIAPPDDIRHRAMRWDSTVQRWLPRELQRATIPGRTAPTRSSLVESGQVPTTRRLGYAPALRPGNKSEYETSKKNHGKHFGPYMPILFHACQESQYAYEYRHGSTSYGAFTYTLAEVLRKQRVAKTALSFKELSERTARELAVLGFQQDPCFDGPADKVRLGVPGFTEFDKKSRDTKSRTKPRTKRK